MGFVAKILRQGREACGYVRDMPFLSCSLRAVWANPHLAFKETAHLLHWGGKHSSERTCPVTQPVNSKARNTAHIAQTLIKGPLSSTIFLTYLMRNFNFLWLWTHIWIVSNGKDVKTPGGTEHMETESGSHYSLGSHHFLSANNWIEKVNFSSKNTIHTVIDLKDVFGTC